MERRYQGTLDRSETLVEHYKFDEAIHGLRSLAPLEGGRFGRFATEAKRVAQDCRRREERAREEKEEALRRARKLSSHYDYEQAVSALEAIPEPLQNETSDQLLREVRSKRNLVQTLTVEIRKSIKAGQLMGLTLKVERFLDLKPKDEQVTRLAHQLRDRFVRAAKRKIESEDYSAAVRLLDEVPTCALDENVQNLAEYAHELDWLITELEQAAVVESTVLSLAERLVAQRPKNKKAVRLRAKLQARFEAGTADRLRAAPDWNAAQDSGLDCPVDWLASPQRIPCTDAAAEQLQKHPGRHFTACGLALQGLGQAVLGINLLNQEPPRGMLKNMRLRRKKAASAVWGLELGCSTLKAVHVRHSEGQDEATVDACELIEYPPQENPLEAPIDRRAQWSSALAEFVSRNNVEGDRICVGLPGSFVLGRFFDLPPVEKRSVEDVIRYEAAGHIPFPLEDLNWGYQILDTPDADVGDCVERRVVLQAIKRIHVQELLDISQRIGLTIDVVQSDCAALYNFAVHEYLGELASASDAVCMLDVGAVNSKLVVCSRGSLWFRSLGIAGETFTTALVRPLRLTRSQAEQLKCTPAMAKRVSPVYELLNPVMSHLVDEVQRTLQVRARVHSDLRIRRIVGCGGGFALHGLLRSLRTAR